MGILGSYHNIPKAMFYLLEGDYKPGKVVLRRSQPRAQLHWSSCGALELPLEVHESFCANFFEVQRFGVKGLGLRVKGLGQQVRGKYNVPRAELITCS